MNRLRADLTETIAWMTIRSVAIDALRELLVSAQNNRFHERLEAEYRRALELAENWNPLVDLPRKP